MGMIEQAAAGQREQQRLQQEAALGRQAMAEQQKASQWQQLNQAKELGMAEVLNRLRQQYAQQATDPRMVEGGYVNSVQENPVILPSGEVMSQGLASQLAGDNERVQQSIVPPAATQYPTYKGQR